MTNNRLITQSTLISKGWTKSMIAKFLPEPKLVPNPHYKCAAPMKLYEEDEVSSIMDTDEFLIAFEKAKKRKESAQKAVKTKTDILSKKMSETGKSINIKVIADDELVEIVLKIKKGEIRERLKKHFDYLDRRINDYDGYASYGNDGDDIGDAYEDALEEEYERTKRQLKEFEFHRPNDSTLSRWCVNYIRHHLTTYDDELVGIGGKIGKDAAYYELKKAILKKIAEAYPKYAAECAEQIHTIGMPKSW